MLGDHVICADCCENHDDWWICESCGELYCDEDEQHTVYTGYIYTDIYCDRCYEDGSVAQCDWCGSLFDYQECGEYNSDFGVGLCPQCMDNGYGICDECGVVTDDLDSDGHCSDCSEPTADDDGIYDYSYVPDLEFRRTDHEPSGKLIYLGFELEVDSVGDNYGYRSCAGELSDYGICWCKDDGSLNSGFEMVSHPMTLRYHQKPDLWPGRLRTLLSEGWRSYDASNCGFHVHVGRDTLKQETWEAMSDWIQDDPQHHFMRKMAQRRSTYAYYYGAFAKNHNIDVAEARRQLLHGGYRYAAMNFTNSDTIEFRMFKGTLKYTTVLAYLETVDALVRYFLWLEDNDDRGVAEANYDEFIKGVLAQRETYKHLIELAKRKELIVEPEGEQLCLPNVD